MSQKINQLNITFLIVVFTILSSVVFSQDNEVITKLDKILSENSDYKFNESIEWQTEFLELMKPIYKSDQLSKQAEKVIIDFLGSDAGYAAKKMVWTEFTNIATEESIPTLLEMINDQEEAVLALFIIHKAELGVSKQLQKMLPKLPDKTRIGIINHFGATKDESTLKTLYKLNKDKNPEVSKAAIAALGKIGTEEAATLLIEATKTHPHPVGTEVYEANLICAEQLSSSNQEIAASIYKSLNNEETPENIRNASLKGVFNMTDDKVHFIQSQMKNAPLALRSGIIRLAMDLPATYKNGIELLNIEGLTPEDKAQLMIILANRGDQSIRNKVIEFAQGDDPVLRKTALEIIPKIANPADVRLLAELSVNLKGEDKKLAENALYTIPGEQADKTIIDNLTKADAKVQIVLLNAVVERNITNISDLLLDMTKEGDRRVKIEAIKALGETGNFESIEDALELLTESTSSRERREFEKSIVQLILRNSDTGINSKPVVEKLNQVSDEKNILSLLTILGSAGNTEDYALLKKYLEDEDPAIQMSAVRAFSQWPNSEPLDDLTKVLKTTEDQKIHTLSINAFLQILERDQKFTDSDRIKHVKMVYEMANGIAEQKMVISAFGKINTPESLTILKELLSEAEIQNEVEVAILNVSQNTRGRANNLLIVSELKEIIKKTQNEDFINKLEQVIEQRTNF